MTPERWQQVEKLLERTLEQKPDSRAAFLDKACNGDAGLRQEVESLLSAHGKAADFTEAPALEVAPKGVAVAGNSDQVTVSVSSQGPPRVGQTVSHYRIVEKLGEGGMGVVYKAQDLKLERWIALKFLPPHVSPDAEEKVRFIREAKAASALDHPNIGTIHEIAEIDDRQMFIVMAYYEGETLKQKIERGPLPLSEAVDLALQMARGLAKAHDQQIVHRDVKPSNVVVTRDGLVKVIDFGLAKLGGLTKITKTHTTMGTVAYMSPEQARVEEVDERADVWSLGVVLYEMLTGQLPFPGSHSEAIIHAILTLKPRPLKQLRADAPVEIERIIRRALEKDPNSRYGSAAEVSKDLNEYQARSALPERQNGWKFFSGWIRQKRVAIPGLLIVLVLGSLLGWLVHRQSKVRWAREQALLEISRFIDEGKFSAAFALAQQAEEYIPADPKLAQLWPQMSSIVSVHTTPAAASVYIKEYSAIESGWTHLGQSPLEKIKIPWGALRWRVEKKGFATVLDVSGWTSTFTLSLDPEGDLPPGMVRVSTETSPFSLNIPGFERLEPVQLQDYWVDKYEVTNQQFKRFVDSSGYQKQEYWKQPFLKQARAISWKEAMAEFRDATGRPGPSTWELGDYPKGQDEYPVTGVSWYEAAAYAEFVEKSLPTIYHWNNAAMTSLSPYIVPHSNFSRGLARVGSYHGMSRSGTYDMAGSVKEWCWNEAGQHKRYILGGAWDEPVYMFSSADTHSPFRRSGNFGFRCVKYLSKDTISTSVLAQPVAVPARNYDEEQPVSEQTFRAYQSLYSYDKTALNPSIESIDESNEDWKKEKITFAAAYGDERVIASLFLPKKFAPPYQTITYFPHGVFHIRSSDDSNDGNLREIDFIVKSGRAVVYPVYKGTLERQDGLRSGYPDQTSFYRDHMIYWLKDLSRSIDYLESRLDLNRDKVGFYGPSWGGALGAILPALDNRIKVSVLHAGGFFFQKARPEVDQINFAPRVMIPTLMLNGRYDSIFPIETSQLPMFRLLGTPKEHKRHAIFETGHGISRNDLIRETLDWLDRYLGPVKPKEQLPGK